jgi:hypothetical protein
MPPRRRVFQKNGGSWLGRKRAGGGGWLAPALHLWRRVLDAAVAMNDLFSQHYFPSVAT